MSNGKAIADPCTKSPTQFEILENIIEEVIKTEAAIYNKSRELYLQPERENECPDKPEPVTGTQKLIKKTNNLLSIQRKTLATLNAVI